MLNTNLSSYFNYTCRNFFLTKSRGSITLNHIFLKIKQISINSIWFLFILFLIKPKVNYSNFYNLISAKYCIKNFTLVLHFLERINIFILPTCLIIYPVKRCNNSISLLLKNYLNSDIGINFLTESNFLISNTEVFFNFKSYNLQNNFILQLIRLHAF